MRDWETLGAIDARGLAGARLQLHWLAQAAAAVGKQLVPHRPDFSEQSFEWSAGLRALVSGAVEGARPFRAGLRPSPAALLLADDGEVLTQLPLPGRTLDEAYVWMGHQVEALLGRPLEHPLERPGELPPHPLGSGEPFARAIDDACAELARYFANADLVLRRLADGQAGASPVRCWPHHFDVAMLIALDPGADPADPERARSIGVGLSPGDGSYAEPYFYVLPWPAPANRELPALAGGRWHEEGWIGAVLPASNFTAVADQGGRVEAFLASAVAACKEILGVP